MYTIALLFNDILKATESRLASSLTDFDSCAQRRYCTTVLSALLDLAENVMDQYAKVEGPQGMGTDRKTARLNIDKIEALRRKTKQVYGRE